MSCVLINSYRFAAGSYTPTDADAAAYITAVEAADGQALEAGVRQAIDNFVIGCKIDAIWDKIQASCILAGARTLAGALVPLKGTAPTNYNFVSADYNRETGLVGDASTKYLDLNRTNRSDGQNDNHRAAYVSTLSATAAALIGGDGGSTVVGSSLLNASPTSVYTRNNTRTGLGSFSSVTAGFIGMSRAASTSYTVRGGGADNTVTTTSELPENNTLLVFKGVILSHSIMITDWGSIPSAAHLISPCLTLAFLR